MSAPNTHSVTVTGLASSTTQATLEHFFSFCGKIASVAQEGTTAKVSFLKVRSSFDCTAAREGCWTTEPVDVVGWGAA
jgi:hypothetical protein